MLGAEARIKTDRPSRYLRQLCRHAREMGRHRLHRARTHGGDGPPQVRHVEWSDTQGLINFDFGRCTLEAHANTLALRAEAPSEEDLRRLELLLARRVHTLGGRENLTVDWQRLTPRPTPPTGALGRTATPPTPTLTARWRRPTAIVRLAAVLLAVASHLAVGAGMLTAPWVSWFADVALAIVVAKVGLLAMIGLHRRRSRPEP
jgi:hypothetical protein